MPRLRPGEVPAVLVADDGMGHVDVAHPECADGDGLPGAVVDDTHHCCQCGHVIAADHTY